MSYNIIDSDQYYIIKNFPILRFQYSLKKEYGSIRISNLVERVGIKWFKSGAIKIHKFFIPEIVYLLNKFQYEEKLIQSIIDKTWIKSVYSKVQHNRADLSLIAKHLNINLYPHQKEFVTNYDILKQKYQLNGYLLGDSPGAGKTITSLSLMVALNKKKVIIIAPKSTLTTVWEHHIKKYFKENKHICVVGRDTLYPQADFFILNYESMSKIFDISHMWNNGKDIGVIVDESHNFLALSSNRTQNLIKLVKETHIEDTLLMSGTPIKALGSEIIPMLMIIDKYFDDEALTIFKQTFGVSRSIGKDIIRNRISSIMHRNDKNKILDLPEKNEISIRISIPDGYKYTLPEVKKAIVLFVDERLRYHNAKMSEYTSSFEEVIRYLSTSPIGKTNEFIRYIHLITLFRKTKVQTFDPKIAEDVKWVNNYEKTVIFPVLPKPLLIKFKECRSAIKYLHLKIKGEVIGQFLMSLRMKMTSSMIEHSPLKKIINEALKKTVIFTSYVDTLEYTMKYLEDEGFKPIAIYGKTTQYVKSLLDKFDNDPKTNPLVASILSLSTGVTVIVANTMVFLNKPWRIVEYIQATDRVHRIGQDTDVFIYSFILDTGNIDNLSTRMESIMEWSNDMFMAMIEEDTTTDIALNYLLEK